MIVNTSKFLEVTTGAIHRKNIFWWFGRYINTKQQAAKLNVSPLPVIQYGEIIEYKKFPHISPKGSMRKCECTGDPLSTKTRARLNCRRQEASEGDGSERAHASRLTEVWPFIAAYIGDRAAPRQVAKGRGDASERGERRGEGSESAQRRNGSRAKGRGGASA